MVSEYLFLIAMLSYFARNNKETDADVYSYGRMMRKKTRKTLYTESNPGFVNT